MAEQKKEDGGLSAQSVKAVTQAAGVAGAAVGAAVTAAGNGLTGWRNQVAQMGATGLLFLCFYQMFQGTMRNADEERKTFREAIAVIHQDSDRKWEAINQLHGDLHGNSRREWEAIQKLAESVDRLTKETLGRKSKDD